MSRAETVPILKPLAHVIHTLVHKSPLLNIGRQQLCLLLLPFLQLLLCCTAFQIVTAQNCTAFMKKLSFQRSNETRNDKARSLYLMAANLKPTSLPTSKRSEDCLSHPCLTHCPQRKNNLRRYPQQQEQYVGNRIHLVFHLRPYPEFSGKVRQLYLALSLEPSLRTFPLPPRTFVGLFPQTYS